MAEKTEPKTLYVSDLDGTLMRNDETLSENTVRIINGLVERGLDFTYATARSVESARPIAGGLKLKLPVVTRNGAVLADNATGKHIRKAVFTDEEVALLKSLLTDIPYCGYVSCFIIFPEKVNLRCILKEGEIFVIPKERQTGLTNELFRRVELPPKCRESVILPVLFKNYIYGFILTEMTHEITTSGNFLANQIGRLFYDTEVDTCERD